MNTHFIRRFSWYGVALVILLCYPVMASACLPFGGGARYLSVLAAPTCLLLLLSRPRTEWVGQLRAAWLWSLPFLPMVTGWMLLRTWHQFDPLDFTPFSRLLLGALLYQGALLVGVRHWHLAYAAALGALACGIIAVTDVFVLGRERAWAGVYENRFAQYSVWMAMLCLLHAMRTTKENGSRARAGILLAAIIPALLATLLTGSRGALVALPVIAILAFARSFTWRRALLLTLVVLALCATFVLLYEPFRIRGVQAYQEFSEYFSAPFFKGTSVGIRLELARVALLTLTVHPLLGVGYTSLPALYADYANLLGTMPPSIAGIPSFHSDWFLAISIGGSVLTVALLASVVWLLSAARHDIYRTCFVVCALIFSISELFFWHKMGLSLLVATWALYAAAEEAT